MAAQIGKSGSNARPLQEARIGIHRLDQIAVG
jgi:hypothetical protein